MFRSRADNNYDILYTISHARYHAFKQAILVNMYNLNLRNSYNDTHEMQHAGSFGFDKPNKLGFILRKLTVKYRTMLGHPGTNF